MMKSFFILFFLLMGLASFATEEGKVPVRGSFQGIYAGLSGNLGYQRLRVNGYGFSITYPRLGANAGAGFLFNETGYVGLEIGGAKNWYRAPRTDARLTNPYQIEGLLRLGKVVEGNFLPYVALGIAEDRYRLRTPAFSQHFTSRALVYELGTDGFLAPHLLIRSSVRYERSVHISAGEGITVNKKPRTWALKIGVIYKM